MGTIDFAKYLFLAIVITAVLTYALSYSDRMAPYLDIVYWSVPVFALLSIVIYVVTIVFERHDRHQQLTGLVMLNVLLKFLISIGIVLVYYNVQDPEDGIFVVPFIVVYVIFTIFETYFMNELATSKP